LKRLRTVVNSLLEELDEEELAEERGASGGGGTGLAGGSGTRGGGGGEGDEFSGGVPTAQVAVSSENIDRLRTAIHVAVDSFFNAIEEL
jgi:hypothetical protein